MPSTYISNITHYTHVLEKVRNVKRVLWIGTADIKDLYVETAYIGSANLTGAGMGMKGEHTRNFEAGILTAEPALVESVMNQFDEVWMGKFCSKCGRKVYCGDRIR